MAVSFSATQLCVPPIPSRLSYLLRQANQNFAEYKCNFHYRFYVSCEHKHKPTDLNFRLPAYWS
jgi:hypothetical protein